jgi:hypothetical protein
VLGLADYVLGGDEHAAVEADWVRCWLVWRLDLLCVEIVPVYASKVWVCFQRLRIATHAGVFGQQLVD